MQEKGLNFIRIYFESAVREFCMNPLLTVGDLKSIACVDKFLFSFLEGMTVPAYESYIYNEEFFPLISLIRF